jgi:hypothetical protein
MRDLNLEYHQRIGSPVGFSPRVSLLGDRRFTEAAFSMSSPRLPHTSRPEHGKGLCENFEENDEDSQPHKNEIQTTQ